MKAIDACQVKYIPEKVKILDSSWIFYSIFLYKYNIISDPESSSPDLD